MALCSLKIGPQHKLHTVLIFVKTPHNVARQLLQDKTMVLNPSLGTQLVFITFYQGMIYTWDRGRM